MAQHISAVVGELSAPAGVAPFARALLIALPAAVLFYGIHRLLGRLEESSSTRPGREKSSKEDYRAKSRRWENLLAALIPFLLWSVLFAHFWPIASMNDTEWILKDPWGASIQHPLAYGLLLRAVVDLFTYIGGSLLVGVVAAALLQMLAWAGIMALMVDTLRLLGVDYRVRAAFIAYGALCPLIANYAFALVKDSPFMLAIATTGAILVRIWSTRGKALRRPLFLFIALWVLLTLAVMRNNGLLVLIVLTPLIIFWAKKARIHAAGLGVIAIVLALIPGQLSAHFVGSPRYVESVAIPLQIVGHVVTYDRECLPAAEVEYFSSIIPFDTWVEVREPGSVDSTKYAQGFSEGYLEDTRGEFLSHVGAVVRACPASSLQGWLAHTSAYWRLDPPVVGMTGQSVFTSAVTNYPSNRDQLIAGWAQNGVVNESLLPAPARNIATDLWTLLIHLIPGPGFWLWVAIFLAALFAVRGRKEWIPLLSPTFLVWGTLLVASPATFPFRYVAFVMLTLPFAAAILLGTSQVRRSASHSEEPATSQVTHTIPDYSAALHP